VGGEWREGGGVRGTKGAVVIKLAMLAKMKET